MQSIANEYNAKHTYGIYDINLHQRIEKNEEDLILANSRIEVFKLENENLKKELTKFQADDILCLIDLSKKLNTKLKSEGEAAMVSELMLQRAKVMDHFTLAYLADTGFKPSQIKLVQGMNNQTEMFEMYFEKITNIIL